MSNQDPTAPYQYPVAPPTAVEFEPAPFPAEDDYFDDDDGD